MKKNDLDKVFKAIEHVRVRFPLVFNISKKFVPSPLTAKISLATGIKQYETFVESKMGPRLHEGHVFLDVGAFVGYYSIYASKKVGRAGIVVAIEPEPKNFKMLLINTRGLENVIPINAALWSKDGTVSLIPQGSSTKSFENKVEKYIQVRAFTLDTLIKKLNIPRVDAIKIDTEGAELEVLKGARQTLKKQLKFASVEIHGSNSKELENKSRKVVKILKQNKLRVERPIPKFVFGSIE
ncbi:MAG: FkbM family methyltransferase [Candidatus Hadarchaeota archaeon]